MNDQKQEQDDLFILVATILAVALPIAIGINILLAHLGWGG